MISSSFGLIRFCFSALSRSKAIVVPTYEILRIAPQMLENSHISVAKPSTAGDALLPAGWQLLTRWHFTPVILTAAQSAALPTSQQNAGTRANVYARSAQTEVVWRLRSQGRGRYGDG
jgi:hypothetical protein